MKVKVTQFPDGSFDLLTPMGNRVGARLITIAPQAGDSLPDIPERSASAGRWSNRDSAYAACMRWNLYLAHAAKHKLKTKTRLSD